TAYAAAMSEKLPAPRWSDSRTSCGTPTIHVPDEIVTPTRRVAIATASAGRGRSSAKASRRRGASSALRVTRDDMNAGEQQRRCEERERIEREERASRQDEERRRRDPPTADGQGLRRRVDEPIGRLHVPAFDKCREQRAVGGLEVARRSLQRERCNDESPDRQGGREARDRDRDEH